MLTAALACRQALAEASGEGDAARPGCCHGIKLPLSSVQGPALGCVVETHTAMARLLREHQNCSTVSWDHRTPESVRLGEPSKIIEFTLCPIPTLSPAQSTGWHIQSFLGHRQGWGLHEQPLPKLMAGKPKYPNQLGKTLLEPSVGQDCQDAESCGWDRAPGCPSAGHRGTVAQGHPIRTGSLGKPVGPHCCSEGQEPSVGLGREPVAEAGHCWRDTPRFGHQSSGDSSRSHGGTGVCLGGLVRAWQASHR